MSWVSRHLHVASEHLLSTSSDIFYDPNCYKYHDHVNVKRGRVYKLATTAIWRMCIGSAVVTAYDFESGRPGSNPEWEPIYYKALITAQGLPEPSSLRGLYIGTLGTRAAEHNGCNWACKLTDGCSLKSCVRPHLQWHHLAYAIDIKVNSTACSASVTGLRGAQ